MHLHRPLLACAVLLGLFIHGLPVHAAVSRPQPEQGPTEVKVVAYMVDLDDVDSAGQNFTANFFYAVRWHDPRLAHDRPGERVVPLTDIWYPNVRFLNQQRLWNSLPDVAYVSPEGDVTYRQRVWGQFSQPLDLRDFPFDHQAFEVQLISIGADSRQVRLVQDPEYQSGVAKAFSVADWLVDAWTAEPRTIYLSPDDPGLVGFVLSVQASRESSYFIFQIVIPLVLIVAMSWVVFWIDPKESGTQIGVAMSAMLTLIAYRFAVGSMLPKIGYLTRMDGFILAATVTVFCSLLEVVLTSHLARKGKLPTARWIDRAMRIVFPAAFAFITAKTLFLDRLIY